MTEFVKVERHIPEREVRTIARTIKHPAEIHITYHTPECREAYLAWLGLDQDWRGRWPEHCATCDGAGMREYTENQSPIGSGESWPMTVTDLCECAEEGVCPRCGHEHGEEWCVEPCEFCGWNWATESDDYTAPEYECGCWHLHEKEMA